MKHSKRKLQTGNQQKSNRKETSVNVRKVLKKRRTKLDNQYKCIDYELNLTDSLRMIDREIDCLVEEMRLKDEYERNNIMCDYLDNKELNVFNQKLDFTNFENNDFETSLDNNIDLEKFLLKDAFFSEGVKLDPLPELKNWLVDELIDPENVSESTIIPFEPIEYIPFEPIDYIPFEPMDSIYDHPLDLTTTVEKNQ